MWTNCDDVQQAVQVPHGTSASSSPRSAACMPSSHVEKSPAGSSPSIAVTVGTAGPNRVSGAAGTVWSSCLGHEIGDTAVIVEPPLTSTEAAGRLRAGELTSVELTRQCLAAADHLDAELGTYLARFDDEALAAAARADAELAAGTDRGPLHGIPVGVKDILAMA